MTVINDKEIISKLKEAIFNENKTIHFRDVETEFGINVLQTQRILEKFLEENNKNGEVKVVYIISGYKNDDDNKDELKLLRFIEVDDEELEETKKYFTQLNGIRISSIRSKSVSEDENLQKTSPTYITEPILMEDKMLIEKFQSLTCIKNPNIKFRASRMKYLEATLPLINQVFTKIKEKKPEAEEKKAAKPNRRNGKKVQKVNEMFKPSEKKVEQENSKSNGKRTRDSGFESDQEMDIDPFAAPSDTEDAVMKLEEEKQKRLEEEEEEMISLKKKAKNQKKRKRIRQLSDSSDSESESSQPVEKKVAEPVVSTKTNEPTKAFITKVISETHEDEDGYVVTTKRKKVVEVPAEDLPKSKSKPRNESHAKPAKKTNVEPSEEPAKPKRNQKKQELKKGQTSIMSFFKPKTVKA